MWCFVGERVNSFAGSVTWGVVKVAWQDKGLRQALNNGDKKLMQEVMAKFEYFAPQIEADMKTQAPWTDRTGNARNGLAARAFRSADTMGIVLYHQVPYGIWLELANGGRYAVIGPAIDRWTPRVIAGLNGQMGKIDFTT